MTVVLDIDNKNRASSSDDEACLDLLYTSVNVLRSTAVTKDRGSYTEVYTSFLSYGKRG
jgi:hypothetical protein